MMELLLTGDWTLCGALESSLPQTPDALRNTSLPRIAARVPGNVELDLFRAGLCPDPFEGENLYQFRTYEFYGWWYERSFTVPAGFLSAPIELFLGGVDTLATVYINGREVGQTDNMMLEYTLMVTPFLLEGENTIAIRIDSAINRARNFEYPAGVRGPGNEHTDEMLRLRKPGHCFGWDIAPRFVSAGIWRTVMLRQRAATAIRETYWATLAADEKEATLLCKCRFTTDAERLDGFTLRVVGECGESRFEKTINVAFVSDEMTLTIAKPMLWWPRGYGEANLYTVTVQLLYHGNAVDRVTERIGIRTAEVDARFATGDAGEFRVMLNNTPILVKGANWVPLDAFHSRDAQRLERAIQLFTDCGCNMVRCWGGNVYEDTRFYDLCDQEGLLVWQDFSLACGLYPQDDAFTRAVEIEATQIVRKHRNHPSLLLWCGDNEVDAMYACFGYRHAHVRENRLTRETLPRVAASHDPMRYYLPSSPYIPQPNNGEFSVPEQHNWGPRDYFKGDFYRHSSAHFISEIGYHGCPAVGSLSRFIDRDHLWPMGNGQWDAHNTEYTHRGRDRGYDRNELMADQVRDMFGEMPDQLERFAMLSQISQAEALKFFVENVRLHKWRKTGILWWNMLDCWPQISDAVVDYYFHAKLAYHYLQRVQEPICLVCAEPENWRRQVWLCNDSRVNAQVRYEVTDSETGEVLLLGVAQSPANENIALGGFKCFSGVQRLILLQWWVGERAFGNHAIIGYPAWSGDRYRRWLDRIEALPTQFDAEACWMGNLPINTEQHVQAQYANLSDGYSAFMPSV